MRRCHGALLAMHLTGCSLALTREPRFAPDRPQEPARCTESRVAPLLDGGAALVLYGAAMGLVFWGVSSRGEAGAMRVTASILPATYGTVEAASSAVGFRRTQSCAHVRDLQRRCLEGDHPACAALQEIDEGARAVRGGRE